VLGLVVELAAVQKASDMAGAAEDVVVVAPSIIFSQFYVFKHFTFFPVHFTGNCN